MSMQLEVNGKMLTFEAQPDMPLLWVLRDLLRMTGTKYGCGMALCGACTVHVDGEPVRAQRTSQLGELRALAAAVEAFKSDQFSARGHGGNDSRMASRIDGPKL